MRAWRICGLLVLLVCLPGRDGLPAPTAPPADPERESLLEGVRLHEEGKFDEAIAVYRRILETDPSNPEARHELVYSTFAKGDYRQTITLAESMLAGRAPVEAGMYVFLGGSHGLLGSWDRAESVLRQGLAAWPGDDTLRFNLALSLAAQGKTEPAIEVFVECLRSSPYSAITWSALGDTLYDAAARGRAVAAYARSLTLEEDPERSGEVARRLWEMILEGVPTPTGTPGEEVVRLKVRLPRGPAGSRLDDDHAETVLVSMVGALRYGDAWKGKSDASFFAYALDAVLEIVSAVHSAPDGGDFWGPFVLSYFDDMREAGHMEALAYDIRCAAGDLDAEQWRRDHPTEVRGFRERSARWAVDWESAGVER